MIAFWKEHFSLRVGLMLALFAIGFILLFFGWKMTGQLAGLGLMLAGIVALLAALWLYNIVYSSSKKKSK